MSTLQVFRLPDVGEGLTEAEILIWHVAPGDTVAVNQVVVEIETAKSAVELPSPYAGRVAELHAAAGTTIAVGAPLISISADAIEPLKPADAGPEEPTLLVGYGPKESGSRHRRPRAKPPVRNLAKELGVDLLLVPPSGPEGTVTRADVTEFATGRDAGPPSADVAAEVRIPVRGVRRQTAAAMVASAFTAPHVTEFVSVDVTRTMELRTTVGRRPEFADVRLTPLVFVARALLLAVARTPEANSRWNEAAQEIVQLREVNLGIAAATPRGLVVPNIKSAQRLTLHGLATAIQELATEARAGRTTPAAMARGTLTITNVGVFGVDTGTPILNPGEAAILAIGAIRRRPWVVERDGTEELAARWVAELALSFDHRIMDGQQGSALLADTAAMLTEPGLAIL
ncbi:dihydrolipoamide acetyltransferase family protein [Dactylosporangium sp. CA-092794]|uniref:dihydrolipoamide acetyltransferase family protein n=1 Tax=Dactylosporangium sp. CA-092794 TaxID=3239929 RepID=UPI003D8A7F55